jgi:hypothetical protein
VVSHVLVEGGGLRFEVSEGSGGGGMFLRSSVGGQQWSRTWYRKWGRCAAHGNLGMAMITPLTGVAQGMRRSLELSASGRNRP